MNRLQTTGLVLGLLLSTLLSTLLSGAEFHELQWLSDDADRLGLLTFPPMDCAETPRGDDDGNFRILVGRELFQTPTVIAELTDIDGLSCNSCHVSGLAQNDFYLESLSTTPGAVDISNTRFHKFENNNRLEALVIPSLWDIQEKDGYGTGQAYPTIDAYIDAMLADTGLPQAAITTLAAYVYSLTEEARHCINRQQQHVAQSVGQVYFDLENSINILREAAVRNETALLDLLFDSAKQRIDKLHRHFDIPATSSLATDIRDQEGELDSIRTQATILSGEELSIQLSDWFWQMRSLRSELLTASEQSLYLRKNLEAWLQDNR